MENNVWDAAGLNEHFKTIKNVWVNVLANMWARCRINNIHNDWIILDDIGIVAVHHLYHYKSL